MPDANLALSSDAAQGRIADLNVSGHLMMLDPGLFCIVQLPSHADDAATGLPGVRLSLPPGGAGQSDAVTIGGFGHDGWLGPQGNAALVRVRDVPAQIMVTIYQAIAGQGGAPSLQVMRLLDDGAVAPVAAAAPPPPAVAAPQPQDLIAHIQTRGDVGALLGEWVGEPGSGHWIEGFAVAPVHEIGIADLEYQAVLGRGWLSPWAEGGQFCGSRGMALPVLGLRVRLRGTAAQEYECFCAASFVDGTRIGPVPEGEACEAESLAPLEAFCITLRPRNQAVPAPAVPTPVHKPAKAKAAPSPAPAPSPAARKLPTAAKPAPRRR